MTRVLIAGGTGFIGRHLAGALALAGHTVTALGRSSLDLVKDGEAALAARLAGHSAAINAAGLVRSHGANTMTGVHAGGTEKLARACEAAGVRRLIHISALGAATDGATSYQKSKGQGERTLEHTRGLDCCILRPSVVIGEGGASTKVLSALAALPLTLRLGPGTWEAQPVHVHDLAALVVRLVERDGPLPPSLDVVGPEPMTTDELTATLRSWLGLPACPAFPFPAPLLYATAWIGEKLMDGPMSREVLAMLRAGNTSDPVPFAAALGRMPFRLDMPLSAHPAAGTARQAARLFFIWPLLRISLAAMWIVTGLLSFGLYPLAKSYELMAQIGLTGLPADAALYGAAVLDTLLGALLLFGWRPVAVGAAQLALMAAFTLLAARLPAEYWLHPFAPLVKNLPIAAATLAMMAMED